MMTDTFEAINKECKQIEKHLNTNGLWVDVYPHSTLPVIEINIDWGDWKHDHLRCDYLMEKLGYTLIGEETTESNGDDCYSAIHTYIAHNNY